MPDIKKDDLEFQRLRKEISESREKLANLQDMAEIHSDTINQLGIILSAGYMQFNFNDRTLTVNESLRMLIENCTIRPELTSETIIESVHPDDKSFMEELFAAPRPGKKINSQFRLTWRSKDSRELRYFQISGILEKNSGNEDILTCVIRDITKENKQFKDQQRNLEKASESDRIKTLFLLNISHNIRTPMNSILGFAELLSMTDPEPERRKEFIQVIKKQSKSLLQLIDNVAEIAKYESGTLTVTKTLVNLNLLINEIVKDIEILRSASRKEHVKIQVSLPIKDGLEIYTDAGRLHQVFINIINHSLKYTLDGYIELGYKLPVESRIEFFVKDTSQGLEKEEIKNIFDRFGQLNRDETGRYNEETGLGLIIAKSIVKLLGGKINFETNTGSGFIFSFTLPYELPPSVQINHEIENEAIAEHYKWKDKVILIVEDEEVNGLFLEAVFQETGAQTLYVKNGLQALELCKSISKIDLILMDIKMPVMNGIKATQEIRKFNRNVPIIAQTALASEEDLHKFLQSGCNDTITKPIEVNELLQLVNKYFTS